MRIPLFAIFLTILLSACDTGYKVESDRVTFKTWNEGNGGSTYLIDGADPASFRILNGHYAIDKGNAYHDGSPIQGADLESFAALSIVYARDKNHIYYEGVVIPGAHASSFTMFDLQSGRDDAHLFMQDQEINACDIRTFVRLQYDWARDSKCVYTSLRQIPGADPGSFTIVDFQWAKDARYVYYYFDGKIVEGADPNTFRLDKRGGCGVCARDAHHCFTAGDQAECPK